MLSIACVLQLPLKLHIQKISEKFFQDLEVGGNTILKWILRTYSENYGVMYLIIRVFVITVMNPPVP